MWEDGGSWGSSGLKGVKGRVEGEVMGKRVEGECVILI